MRPISRPTTSYYLRLIFFSISRGEIMRLLHSCEGCILGRYLARRLWTILGILEVTLDKLAVNYLKQLCSQIEIKSQQ